MRTNATIKRACLLAISSALAVGALGSLASASPGDPSLVDCFGNDAPGFGVGPGCFDGSIAADGTGDVSFTQAAGHPYDLTTTIPFNSFDHPDYNGPWPAEPVKDILVDVPPGLIGNPTVVARCTLAQVAPIRPECPPASQVGILSITFANNCSSGACTPQVGDLPVFNMVAPNGVPARFAVNTTGITTLDAKLRSHSDYGFSIDVKNIGEGLPLLGNSLTLWGNPADPVHTPERRCPGVEANGCEAGIAPQAFLRLPTACAGPQTTVLNIDSWFNPGPFSDGLPDLSDPDWKQTSFLSHQTAAEGGAPVGATGCEDVPVKAKLTAQPTALDTETPTGLEVRVEVPNPGLSNPVGIASSDIKKVEVTLPQGVTINPSQAEGLGVCSLAQYESTELSFFPTPGKGCPDDSKIGTVSVKTPLLEESIPGEVFIAQQDDPSTSAPRAENPFDSLLAIYVVLEHPERGILVKLAGEVETDETTGRIVTTFDDLPQQPFETFDFKFREGARAPLVTPPTCGTYETEAEFTPWSDPSNTLESTSSFEITRGIGGGPCPPDGVPQFKPGFSAGTINNNAGSFSPFSMRLTRLDGEQNLTKFSATLPPGVLAKLAGVGKCSDAAIAAAAGETRTGRQELAGPSCPANSRIGRTLAGAGVGSVLTHVPGQLYLAGPYNGAPLSVVAITPAVAGPFDVGTVVVRVALDLDPRTGVAGVDGSASDPIPHILEGIPLKLRDLRVYVDRPEFTLNATSCDPSAVGATLWGSAADVFNPADDVPVALASRYQAANCLNLGFKPKLKIKLKGGVGRGAHPALKAVVTPRPGDANIEGAVVKLPRSAFLDQAHIRTVCTRVQFAADACPAGAIYGKVKAWSPLLDEPLAGPVYLRSSDNKLPDLVFDLHGLVDIEVAGRIDSVKGAIRSTFASVPDAPVSKLVLEMQGGRKGLIVNSRNLCEGTNRAKARFTGQNGKRFVSSPVVRPACAKGRGRSGR